MRSLTIAFLLGCTLPSPVLAQPSIEPVQREAADGRLMPPERVAERVWVMRQPDRLWAAVIGNVVIIEQADGIVLIDSGGSIADGRDVVEAVKRLTSKPVKAVAITHWHNDHPLGIPGILETFPKARVISTAATRDYVQSETNTGVGKPGTELDAARRERIQKIIAEFESEAANPKNGPELRGQYAIEGQWIARRLERLMGNYVAVPNEIVATSLTLDDPVAPIELRYLGVANTRGDLVAWLPKQSILATGDMVVAPSPYGFALSVEPWLETLDKVEKIPFAILIPGHGRVQRDRDYLATLKWSMRDLAERARAAAKSGLSKDEAFAAFDQSEQRKRFGVPDEWTGKWLNDYWLEGMFKTAFDEAKGIPAPAK